MVFYEKNNHKIYYLKKSENSFYLPLDKEKKKFLMIFYICYYFF